MFVCIKNKFHFFIILFSLSVLSAKDYRGAELRTFETFTYGRFEVKMRSARGSGLLSSFFTYHDGGLAWNELDVEILGSKNTEVQFNAITPGQINHVYTERTSYSPHDSYHVYAFEWTPSYVAWFIDGEEVHRQTGNHIQELIHPQKIMMNIWQPIYIDWVGEFDPGVMPVFAYYDWAKYYLYDPTYGTYGTDKQFSHSWTDEFSSWDQSRWAKATHTFGGNNVDFVHENIAFYNGKMILCLTEPSDTGFDPIYPPFDQSMHLYNAFESDETFQWSQWDGLSNLGLQAVSNPLQNSSNSSDRVLETIRVNSYTYIYTPLAEELDLSVNHTFSMLALARVPNTKVIFKLQNNKLASPISNEVTSTRIIENANEWTKLYFDFSPAVNRQDLNQIVIELSDDNVTVDTCYIDLIYGPPTLSTDIEESVAKPELSMIKNYPNPFNASTTFTFDLKESNHVEFEMFDLRGNRVAELASRFLNAGEHHINWSADKMASGVYIVKLQFDNKIIQKKILLLK